MVKNKCFQKYNKLEKEAILNYSSLTKAKKGSDANLRRLPVGLKGLIKELKRIFKRNDLHCFEKMTEMTHEPIIGRKFNGLLAHMQKSVFDMFENDDLNGSSF